MESPPTRRRFLGGALGLGALATAGLGAAGCAAPALGADRTRVRYWHLFGGGDGVNMQAMIDAFGKAHPEIELEATTLQWGAPYYTKLSMAGAGGRAPELAVLHMARLPGFAPGRLLDPFDLDLLAENGVKPEHFPEAMWKRGQANGGSQYCIPLDTHPFVLYYNTDICKKAGLLGDDGKLKPVQGADQFLEMLRTARKATGSGPAIAFETLGPGTVGPWRLFSGLYAQTGGTVLSPDGTKVTLDEARATQVLGFMQQLTKEGLAVKEVDYPGAVATFNSGKTAFFLCGEWEVSTFLASKLPFSMTRIPALFGPRAYTEADCHSFVLPHQAGRGGEPNRAAYTFVAWMLKHSVDWAKGGHVPAYKPVLSEPEYLALHPQSDYRSVAEDVVLDPPAWYSGSASQFELATGAAFSKVLTGTATPAAGLAQARADLSRLAATPNPFGGGAS
ncbi:extracellular solute-binding protein [Peterkaempfera sp. SMS 1(5)a]|uniref:extracellular solute-binding protein n=1 Tax=Peterkaempfera podocarpi TaxID=3232308 RepID=UPI00366B5C49